MNEPGFWGILVFPAIALVIAILIVWWTLPKSRKRRDDDGSGR